MNRAEKIAALHAIANGMATIEDLEPKPVEVWLTNDEIIWENYEQKLIITNEQLLKRRAEIIKVTIVYPVDYDMPSITNSEAEVNKRKWNISNIK